MCVRNSAIHNKEQSLTREVFGSLLFDLQRFEAFSALFLEIVLELDYLEVILHRSILSLHQVLVVLSIFHDRAHFIFGEHFTLHKRKHLGQHALYL